MQNTKLRKNCECNKKRKVSNDLLIIVDVRNSPKLQWVQKFLNRCGGDATMLFFRSFRLFYKVFK